MARHPLYRPEKKTGISRLLFIVGHLDLGEGRNKGEISKCEGVCLSKSFCDSASVREMFRGE